MSEENKVSLIRAAAKLKRAKKNKQSQVEDSADSKSRRRDERDEDDGGLADAIIGMVHRLKRD